MKRELKAQVLADLFNQMGLVSRLIPMKRELKVVSGATTAAQVKAGFKTDPDEKGTESIKK